MSIQEISDTLQNTTFRINMMITIILGFGFQTKNVLFTLVKENKNNKRSDYTSKSAYLQYLNEE